MIDKNLPEPLPEDRYCVYCGKRKRLRGILIHWPRESYDDEHNGDDEVILFDSRLHCHSFSMWSYVCAWCKGIEAKRKQRYEVARG